MDKKEFAAWKRQTDSSKYKWTVDEVTFYNKHDILIYKGGEDGHFIEIKKDGKMTIGLYEGAIPHIGEATFIQKGSKQFKTQDEAITRAIEAGGMYFLRDLLTGTGTII